ncbi:MAG: transcription termination/antitermination protein NusA [Alistipes sp.]|nr:transcription termination/antitermination protein NusA [Rikenellaceae bacterium]MBO5275743.1 transcription termination/antitermination protein NusA [Alistipes sp.]MBO5332222.1 transcription termination/antitermination protein NusA [Alistipes sp.]MBP3602159.1 transcription termination/antitermination protein NusA [Alistipes sp.]MBQ3212184.1 transcription termination/antitermination protein NusA [Alistipes sp.]
MENLNLISNFAEFKELKNIDKATMIGVLEDVFRHALQKQFESDENFDVIINPEKGDLEIWRNRVVVEDGAVENPNTQIAVSEVKEIDSTYEVGDEYSDQIKMNQFGRRAVLSLRQNLASRLLDLEKANIYEKYSEKVGEIITGEVYQVWKREVLLLDDDENELILPKSEQIPNDFYRKGDTIKAIVKSVEMNNNQPRIILSRTANQFLERLFEQEVPEIFDGLITIKNIVRIPGERAKVAVESYDERIDPVGACVGVKGSRIYTIVKELRNENIDVVNYTTNAQLMIQRSLNPAKISSITIDEERKTASVYLKPDQVSLAIGKGGLNIRLSKMLTGYDIDVYREIEEEDVALTEFADEIDSWIIDALKAAGCDTAKSVLELSVEEVATRADLEVEQAEKVIEILKAEFEE